MHPEKVLLLPRKSLQSFDLLPPFFFLWSRRVHLLTTSLFRRNSLIKLARVTYSVTTKRSFLTKVSHCHKARIKPGCGDHLSSCQTRVMLGGRQYKPCFIS